MDRRRSSAPLPDPRAWKDVDELFAALVKQFQAMKRQYDELGASHAELLTALKDSVPFVTAIYREHGRPWLMNSADALDQIQAAIQKAEGR